MPKYVLVVYLIIVFIYVLLTIHVYNKTKFDKDEYFELQPYVYLPHLATLAVSIGGLGYIGYDYFNPTK